MSFGQLLLEIPLFVICIVVFLKRREVAINGKVLWGLTAGALVTNVALTYLTLLPSQPIAEAIEQVGPGVVHALLAFGVVKWTALVYVVTRCALSLEPVVDAGGVALSRAPSELPRALGVGIVTGLVASALLYGVNEVYPLIGVLDRPLYQLMHDEGITTPMMLLGGLRNLFGEEVVTRLGVQTLLLVAFKKYRWGVVAAVLGSCLYFEAWHNGLQDMYLINFLVSLPFALIYMRYRYEAAALAHCIADCVGLALLSWLLVG